MEACRNKGNQYSEAGGIDNCWGLRGRVRLGGRAVKKKYPRGVITKSD